MKLLLPSRGTFCVHHTPMHQFTVFSKAAYLVFQYHEELKVILTWNLSQHFALALMLWLEAIRNSLYQL